MKKLLICILFSLFILGCSLDYQDQSKTYDYSAKIENNIPEIDPIVTISDLYMSVDLVNNTGKLIIEFNYSIDEKSIKIIDIIPPNGEHNLYFSLRKSTDIVLRINSIVTY